ncbi:MAG: hypothetical protein VX815_02765 [Gemmatimonadota bacterium]|nr:hypothetical protein [Gemmatimonadota bacterium]
MLSNGAERHIDQDASDERRNQQRRSRPHGVETVFESGLKVRTEAVSKGLGVGAQQQTERPRNDGAHQDGPAGSRPRLHAMGVEHIGGELSNGTMTAVHRGRRPGHGNRLARGTGGHGTAQTNALRNG